MCFGSSSYSIKFPLQAITNNESTGCLVPLLAGTTGGMFALGWAKHAATRIVVSSDKCGGWHRSCANAVTVVGWTNVGVRCDRGGVDGGPSCKTGLLRPSSVNPALRWNLHQ